MVEVIQEALTRLREILDWAPNIVVGAVILALAAVIALLLHSAVARLIQRIVRRRHPYLAGILAGTWRLGQIGFVIAALFIALPVAPFDRDITTGLAYRAADRDDRPRSAGSSSPPRTSSRIFICCSSGSTSPTTCSPAST